MCHTRLAKCFFEPNDYKKELAYSNCSESWLTCTIENAVVDAPGVAGPAQQEIWLKGNSTDTWIWPMAFVITTHKQIPSINYCT